MAGFDDPKLVWCAGVAPVLRLAERAGLQRLVGNRVFTWAGRAASTPT